MHIKSKMKYHLNSVRMAKTQDETQRVINASDDVDKREHFCIVGGNVN